MERHQRSRRKAYTGQRWDRENRGAIHRRRVNYEPDEDDDDGAPSPTVGTVSQGTGDPPADAAEAYLYVPDLGSRTGWGSFRVDRSGSGDRTVPIGFRRGR